MIEKSLQALLESTYEILSRYDAVDDSHMVTAIHLCLYAPKYNLQWAGAIGFTDTTKKIKATPENQLRIASCTKTFVAAATLRLWEEKCLNLDGPITDIISEEYRQLLQEQGYCPQTISARHLLTHTSGLFDYADSQEFQKAIFKKPQHRWTRTEQLQLAMRVGQPYGRPGEVYRYSDTGYILLGEIIERIAGQSLGAALRQLLNYDRLDLRSTWLEIEEFEPSGLPSRVHQYIGDYDFTHQHASCDIFGGGGLVSTTKDLTRFIHALFNGGVYTNANTLREMLTTVEADFGGPSAYEGFEQIPGIYRLGLNPRENEKVFGHGGYLGAYLGYIPDHDLALSLSINQHFSVEAQDKLITEVFKILNTNC